MYIEFIGLSGSGKTTVAKAAMAEVREHGIKSQDIFRYCAGRRKKPLPNWRNAMEPSDERLHRHMLYFWQFSSRYPSVSVDLYRASSNTPLYQSDFSLALANVMMLKDIGHADRLIVTDEGILHRSAAVFAAAEDPSEFRETLHALPLPDALVYLRVDAQEAAQRSSGRRKPNAKPDGQTWEEFAAKQLALFDNIAQRANAEGVPIVQTNYDSSVEDAAKAVSKLVLTQMAA